MPGYGAAPASELCDSDFDLQVDELRCVTQLSLHFESQSYSILLHRLHVYSICSSFIHSSQVCFHHLKTESSFLLQNSSIKMQSSSFLLQNALHRFVGRPTTIGGASKRSKDGDHSTSGSGKTKKSGGMSDEFSVKWMNLYQK